MKPFVLWWMLDACAACGVVFAFGGALEVHHASHRVIAVHVTDVGKRMEVLFAYRASRDRILHITVLSYSAYEVRAAVRRSLLPASER